MQERLANPLPMILKAANYTSKEDLILDVDYTAFKRNKEVAGFVVSYAGKPKPLGTRMLDYFGNERAPEPIEADNTGDWPQSYERIAEGAKERITVPTAKMSPGKHTLKVSLVNDRGQKLVTQDFVHTSFNF